MAERSLLFLQSLSPDFRAVSPVNHPNRERERMLIVTDRAGQEMRKLVAAIANCLIRDSLVSSQ
ncbi:MAG: hypothetical protein A2Y72_04510 [Chloroflexi bacterium RBG_13_53_26]|nr:MAG: hypothetical protein A2Y72_04510 [Chloroflexi bacterium RBG_13_53_26]